MERQHALWHDTQGRFSPLKVFYTQTPKFITVFLNPLVIKCMCADILYF